MKKYFYLLIILIVTASFMRAQNAGTEKLLKYYTYGMPATRGCDFDCISELNKKYGFENVAKAGCIVKPGQVKRWNKHNRKIDKKLIKRNGEGWKEKYNKELNKQCC